MRAHRPTLLLSLLTLAILGNGCGETTGPALGDLSVLVVVTGVDGPSAYVASVNMGNPRTLRSPNLGTTYIDLQPGPHAVRLDGVPPNCEVASPNPMTVTVVPGRTALAQFTVSCVANVGAIRVTTVTTGDDPDANGYRALIDREEVSSVGTNAVVTIAPVRAGTHAITLGDVALNCAVAPPATVAVTVALRDTADARLTVHCVRAGALDVVLRTTGDDPDLNGYSVHLQSETTGDSLRLAVMPNGTVTFSPLRPANDYRITLDGVAINCTSGETRIAVSGGGTTTVTVDVLCSTARRLALELDRAIQVVAANGARLMRLSPPSEIDYDPAWSRTGRIAFSRERGNASELYVMNDDGTNPMLIVSSSGKNDSPAWSPDGTKLVFRSTRHLMSELFVVNADGTGAMRLPGNMQNSYEPAWSSTGKIAFISDRDQSSGELYVMNADGSNVVRLTNNFETERSPAWSPDGTTIVFTRVSDCYYYYYYYTDCENGLYAISANGSNRRAVLSVSDDVEFRDPSWSPDGDIAFTMRRCTPRCEAMLWTVRLDGSRLTPLITGANPVWKP